MLLNTNEQVQCTGRMKHINTAACTANLIRDHH